MQDYKMSKRSSKNVKKAKEDHDRQLACDRLRQLFFVPSLHLISGKTWLEGMVLNSNSGKLFELSKIVTYNFDYARCGNICDLNLTLSKVEIFRPFLVGYFLNPSDFFFWYNIYNILTGGGIKATEKEVKDIEFWLHSKVLSIELQIYPKDKPTYINKNEYTLACGYSREKHFQSKHIYVTFADGYRSTEERVAAAKYVHRPTITIATWAIFHKYELDQANSLLTCQVVLCAEMIVKPCPNITEFAAGLLGESYRCPQNYLYHSPAYKIVYTLQKPEDVTPQTCLRGFHQFIFEGDDDVTRQRASIGSTLIQDDRLQQQQYQQQNSQAQQFQQQLTMHQQQITQLLQEKERLLQQTQLLQQQIQVQSVGQSLNQQMVIGSSQMQSQSDSSMEEQKREDSQHNQVPNAGDNGEVVSEDGSKIVVIDGNMKLQLAKYIYMKELQSVYLIWGRNYHCQICKKMWNYINTIFLICGHFYCGYCLPKHIDKSDKCPTCRERIHRTFPGVTLHEDLRRDPSCMDGGQVQRIQQEIPPELLEYMQQEQIPVKGYFAVLTRLEWKSCPAVIRKLMYLYIKSEKVNITDLHPSWIS